MAETEPLYDADILLWAHLVSEHVDQPRRLLDAAVLRRAPRSGLGNQKLKRDPYAACRSGAPTGGGFIARKALITGIHRS